MAVASQGLTLSIESATPGTFTAIGEITDITGPEESFTILDPTNLSDTRRRFALGLKQPGTIQIRFRANFGDAGQDRLRSQFAAKARPNFEIDFPAGALGGGSSSSATNYAFTGLITSLSLSASTDALIEGACTIQLDSDIVES